MALCLVVGISHATNYYVDSRNGSDRNAGTSSAKPWRTIAKVNEMNFQAGDSILFGRGAMWVTGEALRPQGSGVKGNPIVISAYGEGALPLIAGDGFVGSGVVSLYNQSHWVISNLELTNWAETPGDRRGVEVKGANGGLLQGIHLKNLVIHHIKGIVGQDTKAKRTSGVAFVVTHDQKRATRFDDLLVEGCHLYAIENQGIVLNNEVFEKVHYPGDETWKDRMFTGVVIRNNVIHDISKNAMIIRMTENGVVEHNVCFRTAFMEHGGNTIFSRNVRGTVFQYNEGFLNRSPDHDGSLYDPDINSPKTVWRYSYSHDNSQGMVWFCTDRRDDGILVYNNVSEDDHGFLVYFNYSFKEAKVFSNLFYAGPSVRPYFLRVNKKNCHEFYSCSGNMVWNDSPALTFEYPYKGNVNTKSKREVKNNLFLGNPVQGEFRNEPVDWTRFRRFHRGFLRANMLDTLVGNRIQLFEPGQTPMGEVIGKVNGVPVYRHELERELAYCRWEFAGKKGKNARRALYRQAIDRVVLMKVQVEEMSRRKMPEAAAAMDIERLRQMENEFRKSTSVRDVMWFGPQQYDAGTFWSFFWAGAQEELRKRMVENTLSMTTEELKIHFEKGGEPAWPKRGFDYALKAIRTSLLDKKYSEYFAEKAARATVEIEQSVEKMYTE